MQLLQEFFPTKNHFLIFLLYFIFAASTLITTNILTPKLPKHFCYEVTATANCWQAIYHLMSPSAIYTDSSINQSSRIVSISFSDFKTMPCWHLFQK